MANELQDVSMTDAPLDVQMTDANQNSQDAQFQNEYDKLDKILPKLNDDIGTIAGEPNEMDKALDLIGRGTDYAELIIRYFPSVNLAKDFINIINGVFKKREIAKENEILCLKLREKVVRGLANFAKDVEVLEGFKLGQTECRAYLEALNEVYQLICRLKDEASFRTYLQKAVAVFNSDEVHKRIKAVENKLDKAFRDVQNARDQHIAIATLKTHQKTEEIDEKLMKVLQELKDNSNFKYDISVDQDVIEIASLSNGIQPGEKFIARYTLQTEHLSDPLKKVERGKNGKIVKKLLQGSEAVALVKFGQKMEPFKPEEIDFWLGVAIEKYVRPCKYICQFRGVINKPQDNYHYKVYEWAENGDLEKYLGQHRFESISWSRRIRIAYQIANALSYCHNRNILHHDVRSASVLLDSDLNAKLSNFDCSRGGNHFSRPLNEFIELERYTAPEKTYDPNNRSNENRYTEKCDVFSFGLLLWELVTHTRPFPEIVSGTEVAKRYQKGERPPINIDIPENYRNIMIQAWAQVPGNRPEMREISKMLYDLDQSYQALQGPLLTPPATPPKTSTTLDNLREAAELGNSDAAYELYKHYLQQAINQNKKPHIAKAYLEIAVDQKHKEALFEYGKRCLDGSLDIDIKKGFCALLQAHALGDQKAMKLLMQYNNVST